MSCKAVKYRHLASKNSDILTNTSCSLHQQSKSKSQGCLISLALILFLASIILFLSFYQSLKSNNSHSKYKHLATIHTILNTSNETPNNDIIISWLVTKDYSLKSECIGTLFNKTTQNNGNNSVVLNDTKIWFSNQNCKKWKSKKENSGSNEGSIVYGIIGGITTVFGVILCVIFMVREVQKKKTNELQSV